MRDTLRPLIAALLLAGMGTGVPSAAREQALPTRAAQPATPQPPRDPTSGRPVAVAGTGVVAGVVVVAGSGLPARRARVTLAGQEIGGTRNATTDENGRFSFDTLPAGRFSLSATKAGYLSATFGQRYPGRPGTPIQLAEGQKLQVQLLMARGGVITGTVLDDIGDAIPGTSVRALRYAMQNGQRTLTSAGTGSTDDRGVYRIYGLQPGDYVVFATPRNASTNTPLDMARAMETERAALLQRREMATEARAQALQALEQRLVTLKAAMAVESEEAGTGYAPVYFPGTTNAASAAAVSVGPGEEKSGIDFQYQVVPIARVEGIVTSSTGTLPPNVTINLVQAGSATPGFSPGSARADQSGAFRIPNVAPGNYTLVARAQIQPGREGGPAGRGPVPAGRGEAGPGRAGVPSEPTRLWASTDITVDGRHLSNVVLMLQPGMTVSGRVAFEGTTQQVPTDLTRLRVNLIPIPATSAQVEMIASSAAGRVEADGKFTISSVIPGHYRLTASGAGTGWFVGSSTIDGQDTLDVPVAVKPNQSVTGALVTFTDKQTELTGSITNDRSQPVTEYTLIAYPADTRYWTPQTRRIQSTRPATDGRFAFRNLPAGEYKIAPVLDPEPGSWFDPAFLQQLDAAAIRVTLAEGEKKEQNLRVGG